MLASLIAPDGVLQFPTGPSLLERVGAACMQVLTTARPSFSPQGLRFSSEWASLSATLATAHVFNLSSGSGGISLTDPVR